LRPRAVPPRRALAPSRPVVSSRCRTPQIKYWGKRDPVRNTPINSSLSLTLCQDDLCAITTVVAGPAFERDRLWLNGAEEDIGANKRVKAVLREVRSRARDRLAPDGSVLVPAAELRKWRVHVVSRNTFPTAAGLASSAAGYACLAHTLADVFSIKESFPGELSTIARQGSGSACRSLDGGLVEWRMGCRVDGRDSVGAPVAPAAHWPELRLLIAVVSDAKKDTGSTDGMARAVETSTLLRHRAAAVVPARLEAAKAAFLARDFGTFAEAAMADSNQFHATCLDTFPPVFYMNDVSRRVVGLVHAVNAAAGATVAGYTFDAGPNAVLLTTAQHAPRVLAVLMAHFPPPPPPAAGGEPWLTGSAAPGLAEDAAAQLRALPKECACAPERAQPGALLHVYATTVGDGPRTLPPEQALADPEGLPLAKAAAKGVDKGL
jgi:diphosphomevalonate decarboxylase